MKYPPVIPQAAAMDVAANVNKMRRLRDGMCQYPIEYEKCQALVKQCKIVT
jgi:hypothetical protein